MSNQTHHKALKLNTFLDNKYELINILGSGGFGITYLANFKKLDSKVVIKEYFPSDLAHRDENSTVVPFNTDVSDFYEKGKERFLFEAKTIAKFKHQNIVKILDYFETNNTAYFVMDYEEGEDLGEYLKSINKPLSQEEVLSIIMPILDGLREIHSKNIYHRDIKPDNIYMRTDGAPLLIDFGAAKESYQEGSKASSMNAQTLGYAAPEQKSSRAKYIGPYTDLYAIGAVLHKIVTGYTPPTADDRSISRDNEDKDCYEPLAEQNIKGYSKEFLENIDWTLQFLSKNRPQTVKEFQNALMKKSKKVVEEAKQETKKTEETIVKPKIQEQVETQADKKKQSGMTAIVITIFLLIAGIVVYKINQDNSAKEKEQEKKEQEKKEQEKKEQEKKEQEKVWKDSDTNLIWQVKIDKKDYNWSDAKQYCKDSRYNDFSDWRLPNKTELDSIKTEESYPNTKSYNEKTYIKKPLLESMDMRHQWFWNSTEYAKDSSQAWYVLFYNGNDNYNNKSRKLYVRCVRGGQ